MRRRFLLLGLVVGPMVAAGFTILLRVFEMRLHDEDDLPEQVEVET